jgi:hypothetical protein
VFAPRPEQIDPEIWPLVQGLNRLSFVQATTSSCAGVGARAPNAPAKEIGRTHAPREAGHLTVRYRLSLAAAAFHNDLLRAIAPGDPTQPWWDRRGEWHRLATYTIARSLSRAEKRGAWGRVHAVVKAYLVNAHSIGR